MKKLLFIFLGIFAIVYSNAQSFDKEVPRKVNYASYTGTATDTINGATTADAIFYIEQSINSRYTFSYYVSGDTLLGCSGNVTIQPYGSYDGVTYTSLGSSVTWTTTADYDANTSQNTYTIAIAGTETNAQHTETMSGTYSSAAYNILGNSAGTDTIFTQADTLFIPQITTTDGRVNTVAAQTVTVSTTNTVTLPGTDYRFIKILLTGASGARVELQKVAVKVTPVIVPFP